MQKNGNHYDCKDCKLLTKTLFCDLGSHDMSIVNLSKNCMTFKKGQVLFHEDGNATGIFFLTSGKVKISKPGISGKDRIIRLTKAGDILGFRALFGCGKFPCSATALEDSTACFIPIDVINKLIETNFNLSKKLLKLFSEELSIADQKLTYEVNKPVRERIAASLLLIHEIYGFEEDDITINSSMKREDIANIAGTTTETAVRFLSELKEDNIIVFKGKKIKILNYQELFKRASISV